MTGLPLLLLLLLAIALIRVLRRLPLALLYWS
jgi:hypothetical protein